MATASEYDECCHFCKEFDYDQLTSQEGYRHHPSWYRLCLSAQSGCPVCRLVRDVAQDMGRYVDRGRWGKSERNTQGICKLSDDTMYWGYGDILRSRISICTNCEHHRPLI